MPNYVANIVTLVGSDEQVKKVVDFVKGEDRVFDFNKILPMPEALDIESGSKGDWGMEYIQAIARWDKDAEIIKRLDGESEEYKGECIALGMKYIENIIKYGAKDWYDWCRANWGTKWNACEPEFNGQDRFKFDTAWSAPLPVLLKLSKLFPYVEIHLSYADEDYGYNCGRGWIQAGDDDIYQPTGGSDDAMDIYFETHEWAMDELHKDEAGNWVWNE